MSILKSLILVAALGAAGAATAATPARMSDGQYLELNRCRALMASTALGGGDTKLVDAALKAQSRGREDYITTHGGELQQDAARAAQRASGDRRARLISERDGACQTLVGAVDTASGPAAKHSSVN